ncbi:MAG: MmcQ/YjbR family DNA-binding protein [Anaerolineae bacterium]|nr:MmcQ/YjbR family DNA-binding protein [Gemmatimonadaceae bacterium]
MPPRALSRVRKLCLALPEAHEVEAWGEPTFRVRNKLFAMYADANNHHGGGRPAVWCKAAPVNQELLVRAAPERYFVPPYVGPSGWVGVYVDGSADWSELEDLLRDGYLLAAPPKLRALLDAPVSPGRKTRPLSRARKTR